MTIYVYNLGSKDKKTRRKNHGNPKKHLKIGGFAYHFFLPSNFGKLWHKFSFCDIFLGCSLPYGIVFSCKMSQSNKVCWNYNQFSKVCCLPLKLAGNLYFLENHVLTQRKIIHNESPEKV